ncbi:hypothetical protein SAMN05216349_10892 [Oribacterium sp. KHPX15]|jgi:uncharacterized protein YihD (DUF1040 family)|uniref:hypothetical protein n=1 Tax=unclassified Oribacterium TaxID=2629782 RepID=UPI0005617395|nr:MULTISPECIES: hypothetical protein [unclassified Oribacterium]SEA28335.1 hypothetical protein SAMN05216349_10892 [Oribacterium sp. KHPX15]
MRDKNRIRPFLNKIAEEWENHPDLRFGQFVMDVIPDQDKLWNCEESEFLRRLDVFANRASGNKAGTADNNRPVMTKDLNTFDNTPRKIRCIGRKHDFLGDGNYFTEEELEIGKEYTIVPHGGRHDGMFIHIKEHPRHTGYPYYLFEELEPYDEEIGKTAALLGLMKSLDEAEESIREGKLYSEEEVWQEFEKVIEGKDEARDPARIEVCLKAISNVWKKHPDMRLGQILQYALGDSDLWDVKDLDISEALKQME